MFSKNGRKLKTNSNDDIYTPLPVAKLMIEMCNIKEGDKVLDPSLGEGVFYNNLPECNKSYCEIKLGKDFLECNEKYDIIIGNPPYSIWNKWIEHTMELTNKFCYILGCFNFTDKRVRDILNNGFGLTAFHIAKIDWWYSPSYICVFERDKQSLISVSPSRVLCDVCGGRCKRGRNGNSPNTCTNIPINSFKEIL